MGIRAFLLGTMVIVAAAPLQVGAQSTATATATATVPDPAAAPRVKRVPISKSVFGDAGIIVNARDDGFIEIAAAGPQKTVLIQLRAMAARGWVDSTGRMLRARPRRSNTPRTYRSDIEEHGSQTTMALSRKVTAGESEYNLFFADDPLAGFTIPIEKSEADVFLAIVRKAVASSVKMLDKPDTAAAAKAAAKDSAAKAPVRRRPQPKAPATKAPAQPQAQPKTTPPAQPKQP